jgi:hypothetical protein
MHVFHPKDSQPQLLVDHTCHDDHLVGLCIACRKAWEIGVWIMPPCLELRVFVACRDSDVRFLTFGSFSNGHLFALIYYNEHEV